MIRAAVALGVTALALAPRAPSANAAPVARSPAPPAPATKGAGAAAVVAAAAQAFEAAHVAAARGELDEAARQYRRSHAILPDPRALRGLADVLQRGGQLGEAATAWEQALALEPRARDRADIEARIATLRATPGRLTVELEEPDAQVWIDGALAGTTGSTIEVAAGTHRVDAITAISFGTMACAVSAGRRNTCRPRVRPRTDGNVVLSGTWTMGGVSWRIGDQRFQFPARFVARPGRYDLSGMSGSKPCRPIWLEVPARGVVYAYLTYRAPGPSRCADITLEQGTLPTD